MTAVIKSTTYSVSPTRSTTSLILPYIATVDITVGLIVAISGAGVDIAATNDTEGKGMALSTVKAGDAVDVLVYGPVEGFVLTAQTVGGLLYATDGGAIDDTTGLYKVGMVEPSQVSPSGKIFFVNCLASHLAQ